MNTTTANTTWTYELGDRLTMRRHKGEVIKLVLTNDVFFARDDLRSDTRAVKDMLARGWRITRVEKSYQPESKNG